MESPPPTRALDPEDPQCDTPRPCKASPDIRKRAPPPASVLLSVFNWAHSSGVSYVIHRKRKHKQRTVEDVVWEERAELALFPA